MENLILRVYGWHSDFITLTSSTSAETMSSCSSSLPRTGCDWLLRRGLGVPDDVGGRRLAGAEERLPHFVLKGNHLSYVSANE